MLFGRIREISDHRSELKPTVLALIAREERQRFVILILTLARVFVRYTYLLNQIADLVRKSGIRWNMADCKERGNLFDCDGSCTRSIVLACDGSKHSQRAIDCEFSLLQFPFNDA